MTEYALGIDIGGTFTDIVLKSRNGAVFSHKELTTPTAPADAVLRGVESLLKIHEVAPGSISRTVHATTLFTNALIERAGAVTGLLTTEGFRDTLEIARERKYDLYNVKMRRPATLVPRNRRLEVAERVTAEGEVLIPLDDAGVRAGIATLAEQGVRSVAIVFLHAYANPAHELRAARIAHEVAPNMQVTMSHEIAAEIREYERTSTTVINAFVKPLAERYLDDILSRFARLGIGGPFHLMLSNGGLCHVSEAKRAPVQLLESGPAAGALSAAHSGGLDGVDDIIAFDMGGTTAKLCLIEKGELSVAFSFEAARADRFAEGSGLPVLISTVDLIEIGAGGGSVARRDALGLIKVGPKSAGSEPGPVAYGRGGTEPTVTDADFALGYLDPATFASGTIPVDIGACRIALESLGHQADLDGAETAFGIHEIVNENMAGAARVHFAERGKDPRRFTLIATGGAGPVHAYAVARKLGLRRIVCPPSAGVASALGLLVAPARADRTLTVGARTDLVPPAELETKFAALEREARAVIDNTGLDEDGVTERRYADGRFVGQGFNLTVPLPEGPYDTGDPDRQREALIAAFRDAYRQKFSHAPPDAPIEFINIRVSAMTEGGSDARESHAPDTLDADSARIHDRPVHFEEAGGMATTRVYARDRLRPGMTFPGPAVIEDAGSTFVVGPSGTCRVAPTGSIVVQLAAGAQT